VKIFWMHREADVENWDDSVIWRDTTINLFNPDTAGAASASRSLILLTFLTLGYAVTFFVW
jgi:hypothetical protein